MYVSYVFLFLSISNRFTKYLYLLIYKISALFNENLENFLAGRWKNNRYVAIVAKHLLCFFNIKLVYYVNPYVISGENLENFPAS